MTQQHMLFASAVRFARLGGMLSIAGVIVLLFLFVFSAHISIAWGCFGFWAGLSALIAGVDFMQGASNLFFDSSKY
jgi:hypothetical protein